MGSWDAKKRKLLDCSLHKVRGVPTNQKVVDCCLLSVDNFGLWSFVFLSLSFPLSLPPSLQRFSPKVSPKSFPQNVFDGDGDNNDDDDDEDDDEILHSVADSG